MFVTSIMDDDPELQAIRARRLAELQQQQQQQSRQPANAASDAQRQHEKEEEARNAILTQILSQEAGARCKLFPFPEKHLESHLILL